jgi:hypothetical protein
VFHPTHLIEIIEAQGYNEFGFKKYTGQKSYGRRNDCIANSAEKKLYAWIQYVFHVAIYEIKNSCRKDRTSGRKSLNQSKCATD